MRLKIAFVTCILLALYLSARSQNSLITYLSPVPGSKYVNKETNLIIRTSGLINLETVGSSSFRVQGSKSGLHPGEIILSDSKTILFKPVVPFSAAETVFVKINKGVKTTSGDEVEPVSYSFTIKTRELYCDPLKSIEDETNGVEARDFSSGSDSLPPDFPNITVLVSNNPSPEYLFLSNMGLGQVSNTPYLIILDNDAVPYFYMKMKKNCMDFKKQPNGDLTYYDLNTRKFYEISNSYVKVDSFYCGNNYSTDSHELRVMNNGHALLMSYDIQIVDMSHIITGGDTAAKVTGLIVQEIDENKNVVFQWRSWDHFQITDATHENLLAHDIDYVHGNAIEIDNDGNLMISCRHMDEITKINRSTGSIIWRWGGKNNQFTFVNDPIKFSHQHAIRRIANGNVTMYDNGNFHTPHFSRAVEYNLNEQTKVATLVWEYRNTPGIYGQAFGYVQRLNNGNTLISWGSTNPTVTEVRPDGTKAFVLTLPEFVYSYRVYRFDWQGQVGLNKKQDAVPQTFKLYQNYPNPFNPVTKIRFDVPTPLSPPEGGKKSVGLVIYDVLGREIAVLVNEELKPGSYEIEWDASNYSSGIYLCKLSGEEFAEIKKMTLIK